MNKFETALQNICKVFVNIFKDIDRVAVIAEPFVDIAFPQLAPLYNAGANGAAAAISAANKVYVPTATDSANLVAIAVAVEPVLQQFATASGLTTPTTGTVMAYAQALQQSIKAAQPAPAA